METVFSRYFDLLPEPVLVLSSLGEILYANHSFLQQFSISPIDVTGDTLQNLSGTDETSIIELMNSFRLSQALVDGALKLPVNGEQRTVCCQGGLLPSENDNDPSLVFIRFLTGSITGEEEHTLKEQVSKLKDELSEKSLIEEDLRRSERLFRELADAMPQIVWTAEADGTTSYLNNRWYELTGKEKILDVSKKSSLSVMHPEDRARCQKLWDESVETGKDFQIEYRYKFATDDSYRWHLGRGVAIRDESGKIIRWFGTSTDIHEQKTAAAQLEQAVAERTASLRDAVSQMEEFSYSVSHDLRTPIRIMQEFAKVLLEDCGNEISDEGKGYLDRIIKAGQKLDLLIRDILAFSKLGREQINLQVVSLNDLIDEIIEQSPELQQPKANVQVSPLPSVLTHQSSLSQVFQNLLANAIKFVAEDTTPFIRIYSEIRQPYARIWIEDNGIGIAPGDQQRIFKLFTRINKSENFPGTGVGLAIVKKVVERMGGTVGVHSDGINGSKFWIDLKMPEA